MLKTFEKFFILFLSFGFMYYISERLINSSLNEKDNIKVFIKHFNKHFTLNKYENDLIEDIIFPDMNSKEIIGYDDIKSQIDNLVIKPLVSNFNYLPNGIIFHGPPGTGKTLFAKYIVNKTNIPLLNFDIATIENKYYGETSKFIKAVFSLANKIQPCIIFMDEIDGICSERSSLDQFHVNNMKTQLLKNLDGISSNNSKIICIGTTNKLNFIDKAMKRRMRTYINFSLPSLIDIKNQFEYFLQNSTDLFNLLTDDDFNNCIGLSCSDINEISKQILLHSQYDSEFSISSIISKFK